MSDDALLLGVWRYLVPLPPIVWNGQVEANGRNMEAALAFMTPDHHRVRNYAVVELPRRGRPLEPEDFAAALDLPLERTIQILDELEAHMTFVYRTNGRAVDWAYPVSVGPTPHHVAFSTGERIDAAWAIDSIATPFVQGRLRNEPLSFTITTECGHCGQPLHLEIDSSLNYRVLEAGAEPMIFVPMMGKIKDKSIIDAFWRKSIFFWSEEHAREARARDFRLHQRERSRGTYMTLPQAVYVTPLTQGPLFGLK